VASASGLATVQGFSPQLFVDQGGSKGGWDPYTYKRRNKRRDKINDVRQFMADVLGANLTTRLTLSSSRSKRPSRPRVRRWLWHRPASTQKPVWR
jgi:hypothetical protein